MENHSQKSRRNCCWTIALGCWVLGTSTLGGLAAHSPDQPLQIGIIQRFGENPRDQIRIQAPDGDTLTLQSPTQNHPTVPPSTTVTLTTEPQTLASPQLRERVVLSSHRSFESAEASAQVWQEQGIPVEIGQPKSWEVWADRSTYRTPLLRRLLVQSLQQGGIETAFLETEVLTQVPQVISILDGDRHPLSRLSIQANQGVLLVDGRPYPGSLKLQPNAYGSYTLVNQVPLEAYLRGVVPYEIWPTAPQAAVEAQAILARTYVLRNLRRFKIDNYQLCATTQCQVYKGLGGVQGKTDRAIAVTRGEVLTYQGALIDAVYSSTTGGITAPFEDVWQGEGRPYLQAVVDAVAPLWNLSQRSLAQEDNFQDFIALRQGFNEQGWRRFRWRQNSSLEELNQELRAYLVTKNHPLADFQTIQGLEVTGRSRAGRVLQLTAQTNRGPVILAKDEVRRAFTALNSTLFYLEPMDQGRGLQGYEFVGGGLGHGVGLSQTGSYRLADLGWSRQEILRFYYPGTQLRHLTTRQIPSSRD